VNTNAAASTPTRIFLIDDHPAIRDAVRDAIEDRSSFVVSGGAGTAAEAIDAMKQNQPDIAVLDLSLPDAHGLDLVSLIGTRFPETEVLVFSMYEETIYAERALRSGARGYVMKTEPIGHLIDALETVRRDCIYLSSRMLRQVLGGDDARGDDTLRAAIESLTDREIEVFQLIGEGYTVADIQHHLNVSRGAIDKYRRRAMKKMSCTSVRDLLRLAVLWVHHQGRRDVSEATRSADIPVEAL
jgi:DNA-binding NarL/FixJ family response regulator